MLTQILQHTRAMFIHIRMHRWSCIAPAGSPIYINWDTVAAPSLTSTWVHNPERALSAFGHTQISNWEQRLCTSLYEWDYMKEDARTPVHPLWGKHGPHTGVHYSTPMWTRPLLDHMIEIPLWQIEFLIWNKNSARVFEHLLFWYT